MPRIIRPMLLRKTALFVSLFLFSVTAQAVPKNELPLYGDSPKSPEEIATDKQFIADVVKAAGTKEKALEAMIDRGWDMIDKHDISGAIRRFNQAYLLSPNDYRIYWGLGIASGMQGDFNKSIELFEKGSGMNSKDSRFLADFGFSLVNQGIEDFQTLREENGKKLFDKAETLYLEAQKIAPKTALPYTRMAILKYYLGDCPAAHSNLEKSKSLGGEGIEPAFEKDLNERCPVS